MGKKTEVSGFFCSLQCLWIATSLTDSVHVAKQVARRTWVINVTFSILKVTAIVQLYVFNHNLYGCGATYFHTAATGTQKLCSFIEL